MGTYSLNASLNNGIVLTPGGAYESPFTVTTAGTIATGGVGIAAGDAATVQNQGVIGAGQSGISLAGGGYVGNTGTVSGYYGVRILSDGTVYNAGTITGGGPGSGLSTGVYIRGNNSQNALLINAAGGQISGNWQGVSLLDGTTTLQNAGTITGVIAYGVYLNDGATLTNEAGGLITGHRNGIFTRYGTALILNEGTINGGDNGVTMHSDGTVTNYGTISGGSYALKFTGSNQVLQVEAGDVFIGAVQGNSSTLALGALAGSFSLSSQFQGFSDIEFTAQGWTLAGTSAQFTSGISVTGIDQGGTLDITDFAATAATYISHTGLVLSNATASETIAITTNGATGFTITSDGAAGTDIAAFNGLGHYTYASFGIDITNTGPAFSPFTITAQGTVVAQQSGVYSHIASPTLVNQGLIESKDGNGVSFTAGGYVGNGAGATISGNSRGIFIQGDAGSIANAGSIIGVNEEGIELDAGGTVSNSTTGLISGDTAVLVTNAAGTLFNAGSIAGTGNSVGIQFTAGGLVSNASTGTITSANAFGIYVQNATGTVLNEGQISGTTAIRLGAGGSVSNAGVNATLTGNDGIDIFNAAGTIFNAGSIIASGEGVYLQSGGIVANSGTAALINGDQEAVRINGGAGTVTNDGTIGGAQIAVYLGYGGTITNTNTASLLAGNAAGGADGAEITQAAGTVINAGAITGWEGVYLGAGGLVSNTTAAADIYGSHIGIEIKSTGTLLNTGTVTGRTDGIELTTGYVANNGTAAAIGGYTGVNFTGAAGTVFNQGSITGQQNYSAHYGIDIAGGGLVTNAGTASHISGNTAIRFAAGSGTLLNAGTVTANSTAVRLSAGGTVSNIGAAAQIVSTGEYAIRMTGSLPEAVFNQGLISGSTGGVQLSHGGYLSNASTGHVTASQNVIAFGAYASTVFNAGSITGGQLGILFNGDGSLTNAGTAALIQAASGVEFNAAGTAYNEGTITGSQTAGIALLGGGTVTNAGTASLIYGAQYGINVMNGAGTIFNQGSIAGGNGNGITLDDGGNVTNDGASAGISGYYGIQSSDNATISNDGHITGTGRFGVYLGQGGSVANNLASAGISGGNYGVRIIRAGGTVDNAGTITGTFRDGIYLGNGGAVTNSGTAALITGATGIGAGGFTSISNDGAIIATGANAVQLFGGGTVTNNLASARITGTRYGVELLGSNDVAENAGTITGTAGMGVYLFSGGTVGNTATGTISGGLDGIKINRSIGTIINAGSILSANGVGAYLVQGGTIDNAANAQISGATMGVRVWGNTGTLDNAGTITATDSAGTGVFMYAGGTIINSGTIAGGNIAVYFGANSSARLVAETGAVFSGLIEDMHGNGVLELNGSGSIGGIGDTLTGFSSFAFDHAAAWTLSGSAAALAAGQIITGFTFGDSIAITDFAATAETYITGTGLVLSDGRGGYETLSLTARQPNADFAISTNGTATSIAETGIHTLVTTYAGNLTITNDGAYLNAFTIANTAAVTFASGTIVSSDVAGVSLTNYGTIQYNFGTGSLTTVNPAVDFYQGGTVENLGTAALISGFYGVKIDNGTGVVYNQGHILANIGTYGYATGTGVLLNDGGTVTNYGAGADIAGYGYGVLINNAAGTVINDGGAISATAPNSPRIAAVSLQDGGYIGNLGAGALLTGGAQLYGDGKVVNQGIINAGIGIRVGGGAGYVYNSGNINAVYTGIGAYLNNGGTQSASITNAGQITASDSYGIGVEIKSEPIYYNNAGTVEPGTLYNTGQIAASGAHGTGVKISGGYIRNYGAAASITGGEYGIIIGNLGSDPFFPQSGGTVQNTGGTIIGTSNAGITMQAGGYVYNGGTAALISGGSVGVAIEADFGIANGAGGYNIYQTYGSLFNQGTIAGGTIGVLLQGGTAESVFNAGGGTITGTAGDGISLGIGGYVYNGAQALIHGGKTGIALAGTGTLVNYGGVTGGTSGVEIYGTSGAMVINSGLISGLNGNGVALQASGPGAYVYVHNSGTIIGNYDGVLLASGGYVANLGTSANIQGGTFGIDINPQHGSYSLANTIVNYGGTITGGNAGVRVWGGQLDLVVNAGYGPDASGGTITGGTGIYLAGAFNVVANAGLIAGTNTTLGYGVALGGFYIPGIAGAPFLAGLPFTFDDTNTASLSLLTNASTGTISGAFAGVGVRGSGDGRVINEGLITGGNTGVLFSSGGAPTSTYSGAVYNLGIISGATYGVVLNNAYALLLNAGTISGGTDAVLFEGTGHNELVVYAGAVFNGGVVASASASNILDLFNTTSTQATIAGVGSQFTGFGTIDFGAGSWVLAGDSAALASGETIDDFAPFDTIDLTNVVADSVVYADGVLTLYEGTSIAGTLNVPGLENITQGSFAVETDGNGGTDVYRLGPNPNTLSVPLTYGVTLTPGGRYQSPFTLSNTGTINAQRGAGIFSRYTASVTVYGSVSGEYGGVVLTKGGTLIADGTITNGDGNYSNYAVEFGRGAATLVVENGASFTGTVAANSAYANALVSSISNLAGIGTQYTGFNSIDFTTGRQTIAGTSRGLATGQTINGFAPGDVIDITDATVNAVSLTNGVLTLFDNGVQTGSLNVTGAGPYNTDFALISDGSTGTEIISLKTRTISTTINAGVTLGADLTYSNDLVITNTGAVFDTDIFGRAVSQSGAGHIDIAHGATVTGFIGVYQDDGTGAVIDNAGEIDGDYVGIALHIDGTLLNTGSIENGQYGVAVYQNGTLDNQGLISGVQAGVVFVGGASNPATLENGGTIAGSSGTAVIMHGNADLIIDAGAVFDGNVTATGAADMLELSAKNGGATLSGIGTDFTGFSTFQFDNGANWVLSGDSAALAAGQSFAGNGTIDITDLQANGETFLNGVLSLYEGTTLVGTMHIETLRPADSSDFTVTQGTGGTEIVLGQPSPHIISTSLSNGVVLTPTGAYQSALTITNTGAVSSGTNYGISSFYAATILNYGVLSGGGRAVVYLRAGSNVTNAAGGIINGALYQVNGSDTLINAGTIDGRRVQLIGSHIYLNNQAGGQITSGDQVLIRGAATVVNAGTIDLSADGLDLQSGGTVTNTGTIIGGAAGIEAGGSSQINNAGYIGGGSGISASSGQLTVQNSGTIEGTNYAINFGRAAAADLIAAPGAVFIGSVYAAAGYNNTLELTGGSTPGTLTGLNSQFTNFNEIIIDNNAAWTLTGAGGHNTIDITGLAGPATPQIVTIGASDELTIGNLTLTFDPSEQGRHFTIASDNHGGTEITNDVLCFLAGTNIATPTGEALVETLKIGDAILTADGRTVPVRWIGIHTAASRFADPMRIMPIRIHQGALGDGLPHRDLLVSPDHAMFLDGILVQANALVNHINITRERNMPERFTYYHVELAAHDLILAEGAATETFVDNVDRMAFDNWHEHEALYGNDARIEELPHPRAKSTRQIPPALRQRLLGNRGLIAVAG